jgi:uncharacterized protein YcfL
MGKIIIILISLFLLTSCKAQKELLNLERNCIENEGFVKLILLNYPKLTKFNIEAASKDFVKANFYSFYSCTNCHNQKPLLEETSSINNFKLNS